MSIDLALVPEWSICEYLSNGKDLHRRRPDVYRLSEIIA